MDEVGEKEAPVELGEFFVEDDVGGDEKGDSELVFHEKVEGDGSRIHFRAVFTHKSVDGLSQDTSF